jgi:thiol-disulfide isomerase/thioredoxin
MFALLTVGFINPMISQDVRLFETFDDFEHVLQQKNDTTYVINFWATWCVPCVKEMPEFMKVNNKFGQEKFKMILVSLDFESQLESRVKPFIKESNIDAEVILLADSKQHKWIDKVDKNWGGSIPATLIYNKDFYLFREETMTFEQLNEIITKNIKK